MMSRFYHSRSLCGEEDIFFHQKTRGMREMKTLQITITTKKGKLSTVNVTVDEETARVLDGLNDESLKQQYLYEEYLMQNREKWYNRKTVSLESVIGSNVEPCTEPDALEQTVEKSLKHSELLQAIERLIPSQKQVIELYFFEGKTQREIADIRGTHITAVNKQIGRALNQLKKL